MSDFSRRDLLKHGGMLAIGLMAPPWLASIAKADMIRQNRGGKVDPDQVLVVVQLTGGNDGLNTIVPYAQKRYYELRPNLALAEDGELLKIDERLGFHPSLAGLAELYNEKKVAIVQGVGYPNANRSHFKSMEIWQSASPTTSLKHGWIGRHFDQQLGVGPLNPVVAIGLSTEKPRALSAEDASIPCFASLADIQNMVGDPSAERLLRQIQGKEANAGTDERIIQQANLSALDAMAQLRDQLGKFTPTQTYANDAFGQGLKQVAQIVATSPATRVVYFSAGGFDTHARQTEQHARLLKGLGDALLAFQREIERAGRADKVVTMVFSEFGRRSYENGSMGTDHGAAAPMFILGSRVKGGLYGPLPDLGNLDQGDLRFEIDFRQVYATALDAWLGGESGKVLGGSFAHVPVLK